MDTRLAKVGHWSQILSFALALWLAIRPVTRWAGTFDTSHTTYLLPAAFSLSLIAAGALHLAAVLMTRKGPATLAPQPVGQSDTEKALIESQSRVGQLEQKLRVAQSRNDEHEWLFDIAREQADGIHRFLNITRWVIGKYELFDRADPYIEFQMIVDNRSVYEVCFADPMGVIFFRERELSGTLSWTERTAPTHGNEGVVTLKQRLDKNDVIHILNGREATFDFSRLKLGIKGDAAFDGTVRPQIANLGHPVTNEVLFERYPKLDMQIVRATFSVRHDHRIERAITATFFTTIELAINSRRDRTIRIDRIRLYLPMLDKTFNVDADSSPKRLSRRQYIDKKGETNRLDSLTADLDNLASSPLRFENGTSISGGLQFTLGELAMDDGTVTRMKGRRFELTLIDDIGEEHVTHGEIEWANER